MEILLAIAILAAAIYLWICAMAYADGEADGQSGKWEYDRWFWCRPAYLLGRAQLGKKRRLRIRQRNRQKRGE